MFEVMDSIDIMREVITTIALLFLAPWGGYILYTDFKRASRNRRK